MTKKSKGDSDHDHGATDPHAKDTSMSMSRRSLLAGAAVGSIGAAGLGFSGFMGSAQAHGSSKNKSPWNSHYHPKWNDRRRCGGDRSSDEIALVNGKFVDGKTNTFRDMVIKNGRIAKIGRADGLGRNARVIDLRGKTVIPGLINMHVHHSRTGTTPDYEVRDIETAFSIKEIQELIARRAKGVPNGRFVGCHLGWHYVQLAENRPPTKAELNAATSNHPVYVSGRAGIVENFFSVVNSMGEAIFTAAGIAVDSATGKVVSATPEQCLAVLQSVQTPEDKLRQTWDNNAWSLSNGVTNILDPAGSPANAQAYPALELWRQGMLHLRHRLNYSSQTPEVVQTRAANHFRLLGDDLFRAGGFGESVGSRPVTSSTTFEPTARAIAEVGWKLQNHTDFYADVDFQLAAFQRINDDIPVADFRWQLIHCFQTTAAQLQDLKDIGVGVDLECERYLDRLERGGGPFYRLIVDSGITIGAGTDGSNYAPNNPWLNIYYMTTGVNVRGVPENADQKISRIEALRIWTQGSAYQNFDDDNLGSFEVGKLADLSVLNQDFLSVTDAKLRKTKSVMTLVGGKIVHQGDWPEYAEIGEDFEYTGS